MMADSPVVENSLQDLWAGLHTRAIQTDKTAWNHPVKAGTKVPIYFLQSQTTQYT